MTKAYEVEKQVTIRRERQVNNRMTTLIRASQANDDEKDIRTGFPICIPSYIQLADRYEFVGLPG